MKNIVYLFAIMLLIVVLLPLLIIKGCSSKEEGTTPDGVEPKINVYVSSENKVEEMLLDEYIEGVVAAEMPAEFEYEALKAQAVAARTYTYARLKDAKLIKAEDLEKDAVICTDPTHCQAWVSKENAMKKWSFFAGLKYWAKIERAVKDTRGIVISYNGDIIQEPLFHSNSGGRTENSEDVFGGVVPYLRGVVSDGEDAYPEYESTVLIKTRDFVNKLTNEYPDIKVDEKNILNDIKIEEYSSGGRVKTIKIGNTTLEGRKLRSILSLRSANFTISEAEENALKITTLGYGHGVGMSQWGADYMANKGKSYEEILKHYYTGVELEKQY